MATKQSTTDYLVDQMSGAGDVRSRKMFGEYVIYLIDEEKLEDRDWLVVLVRKTADEVPVPKKRK